MRPALAILGCILLVGCPNSYKNSAYERLMRIQSVQDRCAYFNALPTADRIDLYLHGVNNFRPSDYTLGDCISQIEPDVFDELVSRLMLSKDDRTSFALILLLHGATKSSFKYKLPAGFKSADFCHQNSACLKLAYEIDEKLGSD